MKVGQIEENIPIPAHFGSFAGRKSVYEFKKLKSGESRLVEVEVEKGETYKKVSARVRGAMTACQKTNPGLRLVMRRERDADKKPVNALRVWRVDKAEYGE